MDGIRRDFILQDRGEEENSPRAILGRGRRRFGLVVVMLYSNRWLMVSMSYNGPLVAAVGKTGPKTSDDAP
jgi:hypothetical protein